MSRKGVGLRRSHFEHGCDVIQLVSLRAHEGDGRCEPSGHSLSGGKGFYGVRLGAVSLREQSKSVDGVRVISHPFSIPSKHLDNSSAVRVTGAGA